jgi:hypothetical protein
MMVENKGKNLISIAIIVAGVLIAGALIYIDIGKDIKEKGQATVVQPETPVNETPETEVPASSLVDFAKCLTEKGVKFYGASWCGYCANQKTLFGEAFQYVNYIECWDTAKNELVAACQDAGIEAFPTWDFAGGERQLGELTLENLSELSGCELK